MPLYYSLYVNILQCVTKRVDGGVDVTFYDTPSNSIYTKFSFHVLFDNVRVVYTISVTEVRLLSVSTIITFVFGDTNYKRCAKSFLCINHYVRFRSAVSRFAISEYSVALLRSIFPFLSYINQIELTLK